MSGSASLTVLLLTSSYPRNDTDNSSIFLRHLAANLAKHGADIHVLAPDHTLVKKEKLDNGVTNHWFQYLPKKWQGLAYGSGILPNLKKNKLLYLQIPFFLLSMFFSLFLLCRKIKPDVIHAHWIIPQGLIAVIVGKLLRIPVVATAHGSDAFALNTSSLSQAKRFVLRHCQCWTTNTSATASAFNISSDTPKPIVIPMGVSVGHFQSGNAANILGTEMKKIILFVGRLVKSKGVKYLIEAFAQLPNETQEETVIWIIGDGDERHALENQANRLGVQNIRFLGQIKNSELPDYYAAASIFAFPSIMEGQGIILLEAMASKTPIIATTAGGIPEVIDHNKTGLLVRPSCKNEIRDNIQRLLRDTALAKKISAQAFEKVKNNYDWQQITQQFINIFNSLKSKH